jgi:TonB family protein
MSKVIIKLFHEPFSLNHAAIISIVVHAVFLSTQPLSFLNKPPFLEKKYKEVRLNFIKRTKVIPVVKKIIDERKHSLRKTSNPVNPKPITPTLITPVKQITSKSLSVSPKIVPVVSRPSQIAFPITPAIQKFHAGKLISKSMFSDFNVSAKSTSASNILTSAKISRSKKIETLGGRIIFSNKNIKRRTIEGMVGSFDAKDIIVSNIVNARVVAINRSLKIQARHVPKFLPEQQENSLSGDELKKLWAGYTREVRKMIAEAKVYPPSARDKGQQGKISLSFKLGKHGELLKLLIENSSGNNILDDAARNAVKNAGPFPPIPEKLNKQYVLLELPVSFVLR